jgi:hypothetical protein
MLVGDADGSCRIFNPAADYKLVVAHPDYEAAQDWLLEDEYDRVQGPLLAEKFYKPPQVPGSALMPNKIANTRSISPGTK